MDDCLFCKIVKGEEASEKILESGDFIVIKSKFPAAPVHLLVLSKEHKEKKDTIAGQHPGFWDGAVAVAWEVVKKMNLEKAYKLIVNGGSFAHFPHEHLHVLGGGSEEPQGV